MKKDTKDRAWKRGDGISCSPILDREFERKSRSRLCHGGWPLIHGFSPKSLAACSRGQWTRFHPGELLEKDCEAGRGRMQGRGDASSGNSARLKDACTGSKLTTSRFLNRIIIFFFFLHAKRSDIFQSSNDYRHVSILKMISILYSWCYLFYWIRTCSENFLKDEKKFSFPFEFQKSIIERKMGIFSKIRGVKETF